MTQESHDKATTLVAIFDIDTLFPVGADGFRLPPDTRELWVQLGARDAKRAVITSAPYGTVERSFVENELPQPDVVVYAHDVEAGPVRDITPGAHCVRVAIQRLDNDGPVTVILYCNDRDRALGIVRAVPGVQHVQV